MTDGDGEPVDPVLEVLTQFEKKLRALRDQHNLDDQAEPTFRALASELERRIGQERRKVPRSDLDRRYQLPGGLVPNQRP
jgi:hypothetical protein